MTIENALRWTALGSVFALPFIVFIVAQSLFFPFITGKNFTFRILVEIATGAWLALVLVNPAYRPRRSWLLGAFALFVLVVALADAFGVYPFKSFWSNYERMDGWVTLAHLFFLLLVASSVLSTEKLWRTFWHVSLAVSGVVAFYGLLQLVGVASLNPGFSSTSRIDATFGNPIYLAAYMLFHIGIAATLWSYAWSERAPGRRLGISLLYGGVIALDTLTLFLTGTRGTILGLIGGVLLATLLIALSHPYARRAALSVFIGIAVLLGGFWLVRDAAWVERVPFLQRLATISLEDNTTKARFMNWGMAWEGVKERPILGWGQENYAIVFDKYYNPQMYAQEQWFDRVHNVIFDWLVAAGFVGLISYLALFLCALWCLWRGDPPARDKSGARAGAFSSYERSILTGLLAAYFFHNLFVFDNITSYVLFVLTLAYIMWRRSSMPGLQGAAPIPLPSISPKSLPVVAACAVVLVWGAAWYVNARPLSANRTLLMALQPQQEGLQKNLEYFKESISSGTFGAQEAREQLAQAAVQIIRVESVPIEVRQNFLDAAAQEMSLQSQESPLDARFPLFLGALLNVAGEYEKAIAVLERAHELSPGKQTILFELAAGTAARGDITGALAVYKKAFDLAPEFLEARIYYAAAAIRAQQDALANEILAPIMESGGAADTRIAAAYASRGRFDKIAEVWEARVKANPTDAQAYFTLAAAYYQTKNSARAIAVLQDVGSKIPAVKEQADELIQQIRSGTAKIQ